MYTGEYQCIASIGMGPASAGVPCDGAAWRVTLLGVRRSAVRLTRRATAQQCHMHETCPTQRPMATERWPGPQGMLIPAAQSHGPTVPVVTQRPRPISSSASPGGCQTRRAPSRTHLHRRLPHRYLLLLPAPPRPSPHEVHQDRHPPCWLPPATGRGGGAPTLAARQRRPFRQAGRARSAQGGP